METLDQKYKFLAKLNSKTNSNIKRIILINFLMLTWLHIGCKKFIEVESPITSQNSSVVYATDADAAAVLNGIYTRMMVTIYNGGTVASSLSFFPALSADELEVFKPASQGGDVRNVFVPYFSNALTSKSSAPNLWEQLYGIIYKTNAAIEGLNKSQTLKLSVKNQLLGEALFLRAFCYFYLVNLYGPVPLAISIDYEVNRLLSRSQVNIVYNQIIEDLQQAQKLLTEQYLSGNRGASISERVLPNRSAATALLSRVYLYTREWAKAEQQATSVISNTAVYDLVPLGDVFLKDSKEVIWQLQSVTYAPYNTYEGRLFILPLTGPNTSGRYPVYLNQSIVADFEIGDMRKNSWINFVKISPDTFFYSNKYKRTVLDPVVTEYTTVFRLGEQYLIRAEARTQLNKIKDAVDDLNVIRTRAGLSNISSTISPNLLLDKIMHERKVELFTEFGHRWLDLKRTDHVNDIMSHVTPKKGWCLECELEFVSYPRK